MSKLLDVLERIAAALEAQNAKSNWPDHDAMRAKERKRRRLILAAENDKRFPSLIDEMRSEKFREIPLDDDVLEWLADDCGDAVAVLRYLVNNVKQAKVIATLDAEDAKRELRKIEERLLSEAKDYASGLLKSALAKKDGA